MKTIGCNALLCVLFVVCIMSGSAEGTMCELGWLSHDGESIGSVSRTYSFSGSCSTQSDGETITNFSYAVTGNWNQAAGLAEEKVSTPYGFLTRSYTCDYDPWLEPGASCSSAGQQQWAPINSPFVAAIDFPAAFGRMNNFKTFPVSAAVLDNGYRMDMAELASVFATRYSEEFSRE